MALSTAAKNSALDAIFQGAITVSLHTADPGATGANELTGGGYARQSATFTSASNGQTSNSATVTWTNLPASTITHVGVWKAGVYQASAAATTPRTVASGDGVFVNPGSLTFSVT